MQNEDKIFQCQKWFLGKSSVILGTYFCGNNTNNSNSRARNNDDEKSDTLCYVSKVLFPEMNRCF